MPGECLRAPELLEENLNSKIEMALVAGLALGGLGFAAATASAMPMRGLDAGVEHASDVQQRVQNVRYFCGYWRCHWVPGPYWGYRPYWHRHYWRHWHRW